MSSRSLTMKVRWPVRSCAPKWLATAEGIVLMNNRAVKGPTRYGMHVLCACYAYTRARSCSARCARAVCVSVRAWCVPCAEGGCCEEDGLVGPPPLSLTPAQARVPKPQPFPGT